MTRVAYVNGRYLPQAAAAVHIEDRGYQFADGVYEVCEVRGGRLVDEGLHGRRLARSLGELKIRMPVTPTALGTILREIVARNHIGDGMVYLQIGRGVAPRDHGFPPDDVRPSLVVTGHALDGKQRAARVEEGVAVITVPDNRWARVDIKTVGLLPNVLAKQAAREAGAFEAWFVDRDGHITEGSSTNAWIVNAAGTVVTRHAEQGILRGVTRTVLIAATRKDALAVEERSFTVAEALGAREAFMTSATAGVTAVVRIDGKTVGDGRPGALSRRLREAFYRYAEVAPLRSMPHNQLAAHFPK